MKHYKRTTNSHWLRRWVAIILTVAMLLSCLPMAAMAATAPSDGTLDFPALAVYPGTTVTAANLATLTDGDPGTHPGDFRESTTGKYFILDFGEGNGVKVSEVRMQARTSWGSRIYNGRVMASMEGTVWTEITTSKAVNSPDMQTLSVATAYQSVPYRYLKIMADGNSNIFNIGELRINGIREQLTSLIDSVSIASGNEVSTKAVSGDTVTLNFTSTAPLSNVKVHVRGKSYDATSIDHTNWTASYTIGPYEFPGVASFAITYTDPGGNYGKPVTATTDGSAVTITETSDHIDVLSQAKAFGIPAKDAGGNIYVEYGTTNSVNGLSFANKIMDKSVSTYSDWAGPNSNGSGTYLVIDMGEGSAIALDRAYILARESWGARLAGTYLQGSIDGSTWSTISGNALNSADWQTLTFTDKTSYRYLKITNNSAWFLNMAEIKLYGKLRQAGILYPNDLQDQVAVAESIVNKGQANYSDETWQALERALADGQEALARLDSGNVAQDELDTLTAALKAAVSGLKQEVKVLAEISEEGFIHPGIGVTKEVMENLRTQINNKQEPWYSNYVAMLASTYANKAFAANNSLDGVTIRNDAYNASNVAAMMEQDGKRAYTQAMLFYITGEEVYRSNALRIIRIWQQMDPAKYKYYTDSHIKGGIPLYYMVMAAEILRYTSSSEELRWTDEDTEKFTRNVIDPTVKTFLDYNDKFMNQHNYPLYGSIAANIFKNDKGNYDKVVEWLTVNDSAPDKLYTGSIYWLFREMTHNDETGEPVTPRVQHVEMGRDLAHGDGDVTNLAVLARMLDAQGTKVDPVKGTFSETGVSIYSFLNDRILAGSDYFMKFSQGYDVEWTPVKTGAATELAKERIYPIVSDEYKGRMQILGGWDLYYVYRYKLGYSEAELEAKAPYFVKAFKSRPAPISYFAGDGANTDVYKLEQWAYDWWFFIPKEVADEPADSISRAVKPNILPESRYLTQLEDAYSIIDGSNQIVDSSANISTKTEGDVSYISTTASNNQTLFAAYQLMFINRNNTANVAFKIRTNGRAKLELKREKDSVPFQTLELPDTRNEWKFVSFNMGQSSVSYGQFSSLTFMAYFNVVGNGTKVDIDYMDIKADNSLTPPVFKNITGKSMNLSLFANSTLNYDFSATDSNSSHVVSYTLQGDALPGATLDPATGVLAWTPTSEQAGSYQCLVVASDGQAVSTIRVAIHVAADRQAAIANVVSAYDKDTEYESMSLEQYEDIYNEVISIVNTASDNEFYSALDELTRAVAALKLLNPKLSDGSLDFTRSSIKSSLQTGFEAYLVDNNSVSFSGDLSAKCFTIDFGPNFKVTPSRFDMQPRNIWPDRTSGAIVFGSNDGETWVQLTGEAAYSNLMQTLEVREQQLGKAYRYFKVSTLESADYYARINTILSVGEFRIYGVRTETPTRIASVSISTNAPALTQHLSSSSNAQVPVKKAIAGNTLTLSITAKQPLTQLSASIAGMEAAVTKVDDLHYTAAVTLSAEAAGKNASRKASIAINYKYIDAKSNYLERDGSLVDDTTDGSTVLVSDSSRRIDDILNKATLTSNRPENTGATFGQYLFDNNTNTFADIKNESSDGNGVYYLFDFGIGAVKLSSVEVVPRMTTTLASRMIGAYVAGSNDGVNFKTLSSPTKNMFDWQGLTVTDHTYYRYIKIINKSSWFGNLSELEFFGAYVEDSSTIVYPPVVQSAVSGNGKVTLNWDAVPEAVGYNVYASTVPGSYGAPVQTVSGDVNSYEINGLANGTKYYFAVSAVTSRGTSDLSQEISATPSLVPSPVVQSAVPGDGKVTLTWSAVPETVAYNVYASTTSGIYETPVHTVTGNVYSYEANGLTNGKTYYFAVSATTPAGTSALSQEVSAAPLASATVPGIPGSVTAVGGEGKATVSFNAPDNGGSPIVEYIVTSTPGGITARGSGSPMVINGLTAGTSYTFTVKAVNAVGAGLESAASNAVIPTGSESVYVPVILPGTPPTKPVASITGEGITSSDLTLSVENSHAIVELGALSDKIFGKKGTVVLAMPDISGVNAYTLQIPPAALSNIQEVGTLTFTTALGSITIRGNMLTGIPAAADKEIGITISQGDKSGMSDHVKAALGNRPVVQLHMTLGGEKMEWSNPDVPVTVSIPYTPTAEELKKPDHLAIWYIDGSGNPIAIPSGRYDPANGTVTFATTHFSDYAVVFVLKTFQDLANTEWARQAIEAMASKGIIDGIGKGLYAPEKNITRADFLLLLVKTLGLTAKPDDNFKDVRPDDYYYEAAGIAKKLNIALGSGDNLFKPRDPISRQDMMVLAVRALESFKNLQTANDASILAPFNDKSEIAGYAADSLSTLVKEGLIVGDKDKLHPLSRTTRAEVAVFLYRVYNKY
ncbi:S-layer homology domain-containing protein [Paenibacillus oenotherae]|uniref:S-layer homology domain-containing protein n=1 Tax=Paenibacillus oenotherae TaxID=1435645 RepID=A0ABS7D993_9BACL|nr:S-layer homology domain-containing protein [Paenibacillus oenotherae]MBW7476510.1 S-layer homology domain-containing protein [Paenibacillus oenotherae]